MAYYTEPLIERRIQNRGQPIIASERQGPDGHLLELKLKNVPGPYHFFTSALGVPYPEATIKLQDACKHLSKQIRKTPEASKGDRRVRACRRTLHSAR